LTVLERPYVIIDARIDGKLEKTVDVHMINHGRSMAFVGVTQGGLYSGQPTRSIFA
jgi:hypothetical protein